ncbi:hypothetical protein ES708_33533 [subsurface metagenome]
MKMVLAYLPYRQVRKDSRFSIRVTGYLSKAWALLSKLEESKEVFPLRDVTDLVIILELERFMGLMNKHIDLLERRIIKKEEIPHNGNLENDVFSFRH